MESVLLVIHLLLAIALIITILLQRSEGGALGIGGGGGGAARSAHRCSAFGGRFTGTCHSRGHWQ